MVRVGSEDAPLAERAREVWVDGLIRRYLDMDAGEWTYRYQARPGMLPVLCHPLECASGSNMQSPHHFAEPFAGMWRSAAVSD